MDHSAAAKTRKMVQLKLEFTSWTIWRKFSTFFLYGELIEPNCQRMYKGAMTMHSITQKQEH
jgi:hypothetical protein